MIRAFGTPMERAAVTYTLPRSLRVSERTTRAIPAQLTSDRVRKTFISPPPRVYMMSIARSVEGKASMTSATRMMISSAIPPANPEISPSAAPRIMLISVGRTPARRDTRDP